MSGRTLAEAFATFRAETPTPTARPSGRVPLAAAADVNRVVGHLREQADDRLGKLHRRLADVEDLTANDRENLRLLIGYVARVEQRVDLLTEVLVDAGLLDRRILRDLLALPPDDDMADIA